jgi:hypothetical protein
LSGLIRLVCSLEIYSAGRAERPLIRCGVEGLTPRE